MSLLDEATGETRYSPSHWFHENPGSGHAPVHSRNKLTTTRMTLHYITLHDMTLYVFFISSYIHTWPQTRFPAPSNPPISELAPAEMPNTSTNRPHVGSLRPAAAIVSQCSPCQPLIGIFQKWTHQGMFTWTGDLRSMQHVSQVLSCSVLVSHNLFESHPQRMPCVRCFYASLTSKPPPV